MEGSYVKEEGNAELWETIFAKGHPDLSKQHRFHARLPRDPRCRLCLAPFAGWGGWWVRWWGKKKPSARNKHYCNACDGFLDAFPGGAEVELTILFVDIRESVVTAQGMSPAEVSENINRFLDKATEVLTDHDGFILAFYGDCIVAVWPPGFVGINHASKAMLAADVLIRKETILDRNGERIPVGVGVHTDTVYIGTVEAARGLFRDVSIFGHGVNLTARLASAAARGEALVSADTIAASRRDSEDIELQIFDLKGIKTPVSAARISHP